MAPLMLDAWLGCDQVVNIDCLLPTGIIVPLQLDRDSTFAEIKLKLWEEAQKFPLHGYLGDKNRYVFSCVTKSAEKMELFDESRCLDDVQPFEKFLRVVEKPPNKEKQILNAHITFLIGKGVHEFEAMAQAEVNDFRKNMGKYCEDIATKRDAKSWTERVMYLYPTEVCAKEELPSCLQAKLPKNGLLTVLVIKEWPDRQAQYKFEVRHNQQLSDIVQMALLKAFGSNHNEDPDSYVLKFCGREEYLIFTESTKLSQYQFIRKHIASGTEPRLVLVEKSQVLAASAHPPRPPKGPKVKPATSAKPNKHVRMSAPGLCLWDVKKGPFSFKIDTVSNLALEASCKFYQLRCCIYHGPEPMCNVAYSEEVEPKDGLLDFSHSITFSDLNLDNIPRMARICLMLAALPEKGKKVKAATRVKTGERSIIPLGWVNIPVFDYKGILRTGKTTLYMWPVAEDDVFSEGFLNPIGTVESNPLVKTAICLTLTFLNFNVNGPIYYPPFDKVLEEAAKDTKNIGLPNLDVERHLGPLRLILAQNPLSPMDIQDKERVWNLRHEVREYYPCGLAKLLNCTQWHDHKQVAQMQALLQIWPPLSPVDALELLDYLYADKNVRDFAISCIKQISDTELQMYLLQLVQVLKYETYLECQLVEFLLERALNNTHIGNNFFWLLRSEVVMGSSVGVRFGLILEAYCRGLSSHMTSLIRQVELLQILSRFGSIAKTHAKAELAIEDLKEKIDSSKYVNAFNDLQCPLDPGLKLSSLIKNELKVMPSKMKPLWLEFENVDSMAPKVKFIYKNGDDLRQDMLTLQILHIIDRMWQDNGLDIRLSPYGCLATGPKEGVIEVIAQAETITTIHHKYTNTFSRTSLYKWLMECNPTKQMLQDALQEFKKSFAGYAVACYVLGIGDRHGDNIMLKRNGQVAHIDFGHIMGNYKTKLGFNREPSPLCLSPDIVYLLMRGSEKDNNNFESFKNLCEKAYMALRSESKRLIVLFLMMVNTGIPELSSVDDIGKQLNKSLQLGQSDEEALHHFRDIFQLSMKEQNWQKFHNFLHNVRHK